MPTKEPGSWIPWILVVIMGAMLYQQQPKPEPTPVTPSVKQIVRKMMADTQAGYAREFEKASADVGNGQIKDEESLWKQLKGGLENVRDEASGDLNGVMDAAIPTTIDDGNRGAVSTFLRSVADGFR